MATVLKQDTRIGSLTTPLPKDGESDPLALVHFDGSEGLSELFKYNVEAVSLNPNIDFDKIMGQACTVRIKTKGPDRVFNGILVAAQATGPTQGEYFGYRLTLRPWLWLLTRTTDCRIFQDKKAPAIIQEVFKDRGFTDVESQIKDAGSFPTLEYCVQYRETDFNFVSRLMEKEGIYYFFRHEDNRHVLVLANGKASHQSIPGHAETAFNVVGQHFVGTEEVIGDWTSTRQMRSGIYEFNDYNYETPKAGMTAIEFGSETYTRSNMEIYDYPGNYKDADTGLRYAGIALEAEQAPDHRRFGNGHAISLFPGGLTKLKQLPVSADTRKLQPPASEFQEYLVVRALHSYGTQDYRSSQGGRTGEDFQGNYEFQPSSHPFRAPIVTPKPRIFGIQTAVVVDKQARGRVDSSQEEIEVEKLSEIYVSFYWDRRQHTEKRSCKLRCAQLWASKKWGGQFIPRIGMEVVVEFLEGDPDRPLVTGCVYNDDNHPPYDLPAQKTKSGIKSESSKGDHGYNEWNFEDKKGSEQINVHAQKDLNVVVLNNETRTVGHDMTTTIKNSETRTIGEKFKPPKGSASRQTTLKNGDDKLDVESGSILHTAKETIVLTVGASTITMDKKNITLDSPTITIKAGTTCIIQGLPVKIN
jgi:type VI secretion system secreted protein VgrG